MTSAVIHARIHVRLRQVPGFPHYWVTDCGDVYSSKTQHGNDLRPRVSVPDKNGYLKVDLYFGKRKKFGVHALVALAFLEERPEDKPLLRHLDGDKLNNHYTNLAWGTDLDNAADRRRHGRYVVDENYGNARLTLDQVRDIRARRLAGEKLAGIAKSYSITESAVSSIAKGKRWKGVT